MLEVVSFFVADIDECVTEVLAGRQPCQASMLCRDTDGSFVCECPSGTELINGECTEPGMEGGREWREGEAEKEKKDERMRERERERGVEEC